MTPFAGHPQAMLTEIYIEALMEALIGADSDHIAHDVLTIYFIGVLALRKHLGQATLRLHFRTLV